ncbi:MAG: CTP synthase [Bacilli bacterium]|nr:CTP synthase [Bacilli bacterium]
MAKFVFVTGGVCSGLGKGITASSIALLLKAKGYKVFMQKFDPYMNVDPGTMSPIQHGEVFVTADGCETDLDLGHYERFIDEELNYTSNITNGKIYSSVIEKERRGDFLGATIQIVPHISNEIKNKIYEAATTSNADIVITEIGGTVGDIESSVMMEALRQFRLEQGRENTLFVHTTLVPYLFGSNELKTKPTQNSVIELRRLGIQPDILVTRAPIELGESIRKKIALFGSIPVENIIEAKDVNNIYEIPLNFHKQKIEEIILKQFNLKIEKSNLSYWEELIHIVGQLDNEVEIALVGKYIELEDAYLSVKEALKAAGYKYKTKVKINWIDSEILEKKDTKIEDVLGNAKGILVPGGFGSRGIEGKILACQYARENKIPYLGICLGMQIAVIEFARHVCGIEDASSTEFDEVCKNPVIDLMANQKAIVNKGGTLRLGNYECHIEKGTLAYKDYNQETIFERHRHRYEFNNQYREILEKNGMVFSGINPDLNLVEIIELPDHPHFIAGQFHPEFKSRPTKAHPLFASFVQAAINLKKKK